MGILAEGMKFAFKNKCADVIGSALGRNETEKSVISGHLKVHNIYDTLHDPIIDERASRAAHHSNNYYTYDRGRDTARRVYEDNYSDNNASNLYNFDAYATKHNYNTSSINNETSEGTTWKPEKRKKSVIEHIFDFLVISSFLCFVIGIIGAAIATVYYYFQF